MTKLIKKEFSQIGEELYYGQLDNGLQLYIIKKTHYCEKTAMFTVNYGSIDNNFTVDGKKIVAPEGIAHFLEHKLFEDENGEDSANKFTELGAETNAFTTFDKTSYFFSTAREWEKSLELLQEFVLTPNFTEESVNREKSIIAQEIDMYQDDADYQAYSGILRNLFPHTSLASDIAGTKESIQEITSHVLKKSHNYFYRPFNMSLLMIGDMDVDTVFTAVKTYQSQLNPRKKMAIQVAPLVYHPVVKSSSIDMDVSTSKLVVGFRGKLLSEDYSLLTCRLALRLLLSMLFGWTSETYHEWYEEGKIDDSFDLEIEIQEQFQFILISLDTNQPIAMSNLIRKKLELFPKSNDISTEHLLLLKKECMETSFKV